MRYFILILTFFIFSSNLKAQEKSLYITGKIINAITKQPIEGARVYCENYSSFISDSLGMFKLNVPNFYVTIIVDADGFQKRYVVLKGNQDMTIPVYEVGFTSYDEEYNIFYEKMPLAFQSKSLVTLNSYEKFYKSSSLKFENILKGNITGMSLIPFSGADNSRYSHLIRGFTSLYLTNDPLIIVDGMIYDYQSYMESIFSGYTYNPLMYIDAYDIENITVIKDADAIYGAKGGNGILFINTRVADKMETNIDLITYSGINYKPDFKYRLLKANNYKLYLADLLTAEGLSQLDLTKFSLFNEGTGSIYYKYNNDTDWPSLIFNNESYNKSIGLRITGGDNIALYSLTIRYADHDGIIKNTGLSRYNLRFNTDVNISKRFTINAKIGFSYLQGSLTNGGYDVRRSPIFISMIKAPILNPHVVGENGTISPNLEDADTFNIPNPVAFIKKQVVSSIGNRMFASANFDYRLTNNIVVSNLIGFSFDKKRDNLFLPHLGYARDTIDIGIIENEMAQQINKSFLLSNDLRLKYINSFKNLHKITALIGSRINTINTEEDWGKAYNSPNDQTRSLSSGNINFAKTGGYIGKVRNVTHYFNINYIYKSKYILNGSMSIDGSSKFGEKIKGIDIFGSKYGIFYSFNCGWILSSEKFFNINFINYFKLRLSHGVTGNDNYSEYLSKKYYVSQNLYGSQGLVLGGIWNPYLQYEKIIKSNFGVDLGMLEDKLLINVDFYINKNKNLFNYLVPEVYSGFNSYFCNEGELEIKGFEFSFYYHLLNTKNIKFDIFTKIDRYKSKILNFPDENRINKILDAEILISKGNPVGLFYGYKTRGVYSTTQEAENENLKVRMPNTELVPLKAGDIKFIDIDGNKIIDENDKQIIGDPNPDFVGSFGATMKFKSLMLDVLFYYSIGNDIYNFTRHQLESMKNYYNQTEAVLNRWRYEGQITNIPRAIYNDPIGNARFSDRWIEDGSFLKLKNITISYDIKTKRIFRNFTIFASGENMLTFTRYLGLDPEIGFMNNILWRGIDQCLTPQYKSIYFGLRFGL